MATHTPRRVASRAGTLGMALTCLAPAPLPGADDTKPPVRPSPRCECDAEHAGRPAAKRYIREVVRYRLPDVTLIDAKGDETPASEAIDRDGPVVLQFVFTTCPTICGPLSGTLAAAREILGDEARGARLVSITIDPDHDRPAQLRRYAGGLKAGDGWHFYTGSRQEIAAIQRAFDAFQVNKMGHQPLTFLRAKRGEPWVRLTGLLGAADLAAEYRAMVAP